MNESPALDYHYLDFVRQDILRMVPADGRVIGSIGCGRARTEAELVARGREVHGVDVSVEAVATAAGRITSARAIRPEELQPFAPGSLDGLILADVLEHMPRAWERLAAYAAMVRPGGWVLISVPNMRYVSVLYELLVCAEWREAPMGLFDQDHVQVMTHRRLARWAEGTGLALDRWFDCYDPRFVQRNLCRVLNLATFRLGRSLLTFEVQGLFRRLPPGAT